MSLWHRYTKNCTLHKPEYFIIIYNVGSIDDDASGVSFRLTRFINVGRQAKPACRCSQSISVAAIPAIPGRQSRLYRFWHGELVLYELYNKRDVVVACRAILFIGNINS